LIGRGTNSGFVSGCRQLLSGMLVLVLVLVLLRPVLGPVLVLKNFVFSPRKFLIWYL